MFDWLKKLVGTKPKALQVVPFDPEKYTVKMNPDYRDGRSRPTETAISNKA
jgi:hypothetical protein